MKITFGAVAAGLMTAAMASASITPVLSSGPVASGVNFAYNYTMDLAGDERLDPAATDGVTCPGPGNTLVQCSPAGTFFTIYDIPGFVSASTSASGWTESSQLVGVTPSSINGSSIDSSSLMNVTFMYTGPAVSSGGSLLVLSGFQIVSSVSTVNGRGSFTSQSTQNIGSSAGATDQTVGSVAIPGAVTSTPEPALLGLVGSGLIGFAALLRRRTRV